MIEESPQILVFDMNTHDLKLVRIILKKGSDGRDQFHEPVDLAVTARVNSFLLVADRMNKTNEIKIFSIHATDPAEWSLVGCFGTYERRQGLCVLKTCVDNQGQVYLCDNHTLRCFSSPQLNEGNPKLLWKLEGLDTPLCLFALPQEMRQLTGAAVILNDLSSKGTIHVSEEGKWNDKLNHRYSGSALAVTNSGYVFGTNFPECQIMISHFRSGSVSGSFFMHRPLEILLVDDEWLITVHAKGGVSVSHLGALGIGVF
jgi:hypothetical protein